MERNALQANRTEPNPDRIFWIMPWPGLAERLARALGSAAREFGGGPVSYLRGSLLPDQIEDWFPIKFARLLGASLAHPVETIKGAFAIDAIAAKRRRRFLPILATLFVVYLGLGLYVTYKAFLSPFAHWRVVNNKDYKRFDPDKLLAKLYYPPQMLRGAPRGPAMTLEEIRARVEKHKKEIALAREKAEKERKEREEADRKAAEEAAKVAAQNKPATETKLGEINVAPIKDIVGNLYKLFDAGGLDIAEVKFSMMAGFKVMPDGSFENIRIIKSSGSKIIDRNALEILSNIGESHALGPVAVLSSATISLDITDDIARVRIMAFAPTAEIAKEKSDLLNVLFWALRMKEKSPDLGQLLKLIKAKSDGKRVDTDLIVPKAQATQMFRAWSANPSTPQ
jgi:TonB-like protein